MQIEILSLQQEDSYLVEIERQIQEKRNFLLQRHKHLNIASKENEFLDKVKKDYQKYYHYIVKQKQEQINAMKLLDQYLNDLIVSGKITTQDIIQTKRDQREILEEIDKIKRELDNIIQ